MAKYTEFWKNLLNRLRSEVDAYDQPFIKHYLETGVEQLGKRESTGYSGKLELFACAVKYVSNNSVFHNLADLLHKNRSWRNQLTGHLTVRIDKNNSVHFDYQPFSYELMLNRYRDYQDGTAMEDELYKWEAVKTGHSLIKSYQANEITFKELYHQLPFKNLVSTYTLPVWKAILEKYPEEMEAAFRTLFDEATDLQKRIDGFKSVMIELHTKLNDSRFKNHSQEERAMATLLTFSNPDRYTFFLYSFYLNLARCMGSEPKPSGQQLVHYYELVTQFKNEVLPGYEDVVAVKNKHTAGDQYFRDTENLLLIQDIFYTTLFKDNYKTTFSKAGENTDDDEAQGVVSELQEYKAAIVAMKPEDIAGYYHYLDQIIQHFELAENDARITLSCKRERLNLIVGQRYSWNIFPKSHPYGRFGFISHEKANEQSNPYRGSQDGWYTKTDSLIDFQINWYSIREAIGTELKRTSQSGFRHLHNSVFKRTVFDKPYRQSLLTEILEQDFKSIDFPRRRYWRVGTNDTDSGPSIWPEMQKHKIASIGWTDLGDLNDLEEVNRQNIISAFDEIGYYPDDNLNKSKKAGEIMQFAIEALEGDILLAQKGHQVLAIGQIKGPYLFRNDLNFGHTRPVNWLSQPLNLKSKEGSLSTFKEILSPDLHELIEKKLKVPEMPKRTFKPENRIFYGPPGTGKTYKLKQEYFQRYTEKQTSVTKEQYFKQVSKEITWWQAIALALIDLEGQAKVSEIRNNRWVKGVLEASTSKNINASIWGNLQYHTIEESETVNFKRRLPPFIFDKTSNSEWFLIHDNIEQQAPELLEIKISVDHYSPNPDKEVKRYVFTTFHQSFAYEDFMEGIKPVMTDGQEEGEVSYHIENGIFKKLCLRAAADLENDYAIFIDEINRGNVANIFGELITLIETNKRQGMDDAISLELPYSKKTFSVPPNLNIYGTMNTADRSIEALDSALRRRFEFEEVMPVPLKLAELLGTRDLWHGISISNLLATINQRLEVLLDRDHQIGHAYFLTIRNTEDITQALISIFADKIIPLLQEYFYNDYVKLSMVLGQGFVTAQSASKITFAKTSNSLESDYQDQTIYRISPDFKKNAEALEKALKLLLNQKEE